MPKTETKVTPAASLALGYLIGSLHGVREPFMMVAEILTEDGAFVLETIDDEKTMTRVRVTVREIAE